MEWGRGGAVLGPRGRAGLGRGQHAVEALRGPQPSASGVGGRGAAARGWRGCSAHGGVQGAVHGALQPPQELRDRVVGEAAGEEGVRTRPAPASPWHPQALRYARFQISDSRYLLSECWKVCPPPSLGRLEKPRKRPQRKGSAVSTWPGHRVPGSVQPLSGTWHQGEAPKAGAQGLCGA